MKFIVAICLAFTFATGFGLVAVAHQNPPDFIAQQS